MEHAADQAYHDGDHSARHASPLGRPVSEESGRDVLYGQPDGNPDEFVTHAPEEPFRLGYFDVVCLVLNRTIGTGIFMAPKRVMRGTRSPGASMLLWFAGILYCLSGAHVYVEYGLNVPRYVYQGVEQSVPRSGGDLNYLQYVYRRPRYRKDTVLFIACVFGVAFMVFGNMAGNSINFAVQLFRAADVQDPTAGAVRGVALAVAVLSCFIHAISRRGGIWLSNVLAMIKLGIMLLIILTAILFACGVFTRPGAQSQSSVLQDNLGSASSFAAVSRDPNGYAGAFLSIIFSFSGYEQPNYVLGEISKPRRKYPIAMGIGVGSIVLLYMTVLTCYMVVVPKEQQWDDSADSVAQQFFMLTYGQLTGTGQASRIMSGLLAVSSFGNIVVMTYTAARVKQEIAKESILPWARLWAQNVDFSLGRLLKWFQRNGYFTRLSKLKFFSPQQHSEKTPVGALFLHLIFCTILIFTTFGMDPTNAYTLLSSLSSYVINAFFGCLLGLGILILRLRGPPPTPGHQTDIPPTWTQLTGRRFKPALSLLAASIYVVGSLYAIIGNWVPSTYTSLSWFPVPVIGWSIIGAGALWYLGFLAMAGRKARRENCVLVVKKIPEFEESEEDRHAGLVLVHETVYVAWVGKETLDQRIDDELSVKSFRQR